MLRAARLRHPPPRLLPLQRQEKHLLVRLTLQPHRLLPLQKLAKRLLVRLTLRPHRPLLPQKQGRLPLARLMLLLPRLQQQPRQLKQLTAPLLHKSGQLTQKTLLYLVGYIQHCTMRLRQRSLHKLLVASLYGEVDGPLRRVPHHLPQLEQPRTSTELLRPALSLAYSMKLVIIFTGITSTPSGLRWTALILLRP